MKFKLSDLAGTRSGKLTVIKSIGRIKQGKVKASLWLCRCDCGRDEVKASDQIIKKTTVSCKYCSVTSRRKPRNKNIKPIPTHLIIKKDNGYKSFLVGAKMFGRKCEAKRYTYEHAYIYKTYLNQEFPYSNLEIINENA